MLALSAVIGRMAKSGWLAGCAEQTGSVCSDWQDGKERLVGWLCRADGISGLIANRFLLCWARLYTGDYTVVAREKYGGWRNSPEGILKLNKN